MKIKLKSVSGSVVAARGFRASGVFCDIKRLGTGKGSEKGRKRDLALIVSDVPAAVAGMFTTNQVCAAPVKVCVPRVRKGSAQAIVVNSGNANACTGQQGLRDAGEMARFTERALALPRGSALVGSTGRIGVALPMDQVRAGIIEAAVELGDTVRHADQAAEAILTSDTRPKQAAVEFRLGGKTVRLGGICKGAGMIQPGMSATGRRPAASVLHATMLCFITTDAAIAPRPLQTALEHAVARSFNRITVDGDMSTNDTVLVLANGLAKNPLLRTAGGAGFAAFQAALDQVCLELARMIVRDGEGVSRFVTVRLEGARSAAEADAAARAVANSALVKTSWHGGDPNWGRIMDALGYSPAKVIEEKVDIGYSAPGSRKILWSLKHGQPTRVSFRDLCAAVAPREFDLHIRLNLGRSSALLYAADLTEAYVDFNKGDVSNPSALGG
ncbi:MAG TPA: bifunctional glutamate N-acetyltransferase/amino-acid acetyltransferase ArgJ [Verrucomicrobiota bacterium]|jgi:glutamate N-acetyltransferase/amino-acid N-acetyltransferase|nr:bifunctional glutamate N-acetyltransferase/amino-acid acetyltransferase ArgJ [Verrucomicrobiota bacterium]HRT09264.1 bifunctional glutamate N-acetyltransferase/amino-acid acetyltransferase ArgJ [Candidatus Paceibacterota bacterium]HRT58125.1 bifunctional glutamate N-acetyltransferase/amino-acid acetyltransferase ArgJ [Candidatus Paceibacterota bacterium]